MKKSKIFFMLLIIFSIFNISFADGVSTHKAYEDEYFADAKSHYKKCVVKDCSERFYEEAHTGGNHGNDGLCLVCNMRYQTHNLTRENLIIDEMGHTYKCSYEGCNNTFFSPHEESNEFGWDIEKHWYKCKNVDCTKKYNEEKHYGGENLDGVCTACKRKYEGELEQFFLKDIESGFIIIHEVRDKIKLEVEYYPENLAEDKFLWEIEDEKIAKVTEDGVIEGISKGVTTLYIKWRDERISYTVYVGMDTFKIEAEDGFITEGKSLKINVITENINKSITWKVSNDNWATINKNGVVTVKKGGGNELTVYALVDSMVSKTTIKIKHGEISHTNSGGICSVCNEKVDGHNLEGFYYDEVEHWKICENKECKGKRFNIQRHTDNISCRICDWYIEDSNLENGEPNYAPAPDEPIVTPPPQTSGNGWVWKSDSSQHWKENSSTGKIIGSKVKHTFIAGACECGKVEEVVECDHKNKGTYKNYIGNGKHAIFCSLCNEKLREQECEGSTCECHNFETKKIETSLDLPIKVYYVEEEGLISVEGDQVGEIKMEVSSQNEPIYEWTMSTIPGQTFNSQGNSVSNDGTIVFLYESGVFKAKLVEGERTVLSEEVEIRVTLIDGASRDFETIKLIKNGPPRSYCQVFLESSVVSLQTNKIRLLVATKYNEFNEDEVRAAGTDEFPLYEVKNNKIKITNNNGDIITLPSSCQVYEVTDGSFNGYAADISINPIKKGSANIQIELTTEYKLNNHKAVEKDRKYSAIIHVGGAESSSNSGNATGNGSGVVLPELEDDDNTTNNGRGNSGVGLALAGFGVLGLLLVAFIGAKMFGHH